jgi:hypothetical protein
MWTLAANFKDMEDPFRVSLLKTIFEQKESCRSLSKVSSLQTAFQTTRGARTANSELAWYQRVRVGGRVAYRRPGRFQVTRGTVSGARRRTRHAGDAAQGQRQQRAHSRRGQGAVLENGFAATVIGVATGWLS